MFERFTERARQVVVEAEAEARETKYGVIDSRHLLIGLLREGEGEGLAARVLAAQDVTRERVAEVQDQLGAEDGMARDHEDEGQIPLTPTAKKVLELALKEALSLGHNYIGTEHILLGSTRHGSSHAALLLGLLGVDDEKARNETIRMLTSGVAGARAKAERGTTSALRLIERLQRIVGPLREAGLLPDEEIPLLIPRDLAWTLYDSLVTQLKQTDPRKDYDDLSSARDELRKLIEGQQP